MLLVGAKTGWETVVGLVVVTVLSLPFLYMMVRTVPTWGDELTIYENGFAYRSRRGLQTCRWDEIEDLTEILDFAKRLKMTSAFKAGGQKITFAYRMGGLDVLSYEYHLFVAERENRGAVPDEEAEGTGERTFGELKATYRIRFGIGHFLPLGAVLFLAVFGILVFVASREVPSIFICALPTALLFLVIARSAFLERSDELTIFENGFAYRHRGETVDCLWDEIEDYQQTRSGAVTAIKCEDGPWISFANEMQGLDELKPHLKIVVKWTGPEE